MDSIGGGIEHFAAGDVKARCVVVFLRVELCSTAGGQTANKCGLLAVKQDVMKWSSNRGLPKNPYEPPKQDEDEEPFDPSRDIDYLTNGPGDPSSRPWRRPFPPAKKLPPLEPEPRPGPPLPPVGGWRLPAVPRPAPIPPGPPGPPRLVLVPPPKPIGHLHSWWYQDNWRIAEVRSPVEGVNTHDLIWGQLYCVSAIVRSNTNRAKRHRYRYSEQMELGGVELKFFDGVGNQTVHEDGSWDLGVRPHRT